MCNTLVTNIYSINHKFAIKVTEVRTPFFVHNNYHKTVCLKDIWRAFSKYKNDQIYMLISWQNAVHDALSWYSGT